MSYKIERYQIIMWAKKSTTSSIGTIVLQGQLTCYPGPEYPLYKFIVYGLHPSSPVPPPIYNPVTKIATTYVHIAELQYYIDLVRNEKPVFAAMDSALPGTNQLRTDPFEPIGEEEGA